jgi:hypothetical protein
MVRRNDTSIDYSLQLKDAYRILEQTQREEWNNWFVLKATEKGKAADKGKAAEKRKAAEKGKVPISSWRRKSNRNRGTETRNYQVSTHAR